MQHPDITSKTQVQFTPDNRMIVTCGIALDAVELANAMNNPEQRSIVLNAMHDAIKKGIEYGEHQIERAKLEAHITSNQVKKETQGGAIESCKG